MSDTAFQKQYRQEFIAGFEFGQSMLRSTVVTESVVKGNEATFLVADTGGAEAVTRGVNGMIPARADNLTQKPANPPPHPIQYFWLSGRRPPHHAAGNH